MPTVAELSAKIEIDNMAEAMAELDRFDARLKELGATEADTKVNADTQQAMADVDELQLALFDLEEESPTIPVDVDTASGIADIEALRAAMESLTNAVNAKVDLDTGAAQAEIENLRAQLIAIRDSNVAVNMDIGAALAHIAELELALKAIPDEKVEINVDPDGQAVRWIDRLTSASSRASNQVNALAMFILALGPALITIGAVGLAGVGALAVGFTAAAAGAGLFAGVAVSNFGGIVDALKKMQTAQKAYNLAVTDKQRDAALAQIKAAYDNLSPAEQKVVDGVHALSSAWSAFATQFKPAMFSMAAQGLQFMAQQIPLLTPLMNGMVASAQTLETRFIAAFNGPFWRTFMETMSQIAGPVMTAMMTAFGNIIQGLAGMLQAFAPFAVGFATGFQDMTKKFADWAAQMGQSAGFKSFMAYATAQMPAVIALIVALWDALIAIAQAAAPVGAALLPMVTGFLNFITYLNTLNPNLLTFLLVLLGVGAVLVNLVGPILNIIKMFKSMGDGIVALAAAFDVSVAVVFWWIAAIVAVVAAIIYCWTHFEGFRNVVIAVWNAIVAAAQAAWPVLVAAFQSVVSWLQSTFGPAIQAVIQFAVQEFNKFRDWWSQNSGVIIQAMQVIWQVIQTQMQAVATIIGAVLTAIVAIWNAVWPGLSTILGAVWNTIKAIISGAMDIIRGIITVFAGLITGDWSAVWSGLGGIVSGAWGIIWGLISGAWGVIVGLFQMLGGLLSPIWNAIWSGLTAAASAVWGVITGAVSAGMSAIMFVINAVGTMIYTIWLAIWQVLGPPVMAAVQIVTALVNGLVSIITAVFTAIGSAVMSIWNALWGAIGGPVTTALSYVMGFITATLGLIIAFWTTVWNTAVTILQSAWNAISSVVGAQIAAVQAVISAALSYISNVWNTAWSTISSFLSSLWNAMKAVVSSALDTIKTSVSGGVDAVLNFWRTGWSNMGNIVSSGITTIMSFVASLPGKILDVLKGLASQMYNAGVNMLKALADGIAAGFGAAVDAVSAGMDKVRSFLPFSPAKRGPLSGTGYTLYSGQALVRDFAKGIDIAQPLVSAAIGKVAMTATGINTPSQFATNSSNSSVTVNVAAGAVAVTVGDGATAEGAHTALSGAGDDLAGQIATALKRR